MLLHNLDPTNGLCNGTCMVLLEARTMILRCRILGDDHAGNVVFIPRMSLEPSSESLPIELRCHQFPVHLAFVMTINKAQGQSIYYVGSMFLSFLVVSFILLFLTALLQIE